MEIIVIDMSALEKGKSQEQKRNVLGTFDGCDDGKERKCHYVLYHSKLFFSLFTFPLEMDGDSLGLWFHFFLFYFIFFIFFNVCC